MIDLIGHEAVDSKELALVQVDIQLQPVEVSAVGEYFVAFATSDDFRMANEQVMEQCRARAHVGHDKESLLSLNSKTFSRIEQDDPGQLQCVLGGPREPTQILLERFPQE